MKGKRIAIDSNLYAYHDYAFELAKNNEVYITERSISWMDRTREFLLRKEMEKVGVKVVEKMPEVDVEISEFVDDQPSVGKSMMKGYWMGRGFSLA